MTIIKTRYGGAYEGGSWAAFNAYDVPMDATDDDITCCEWWVDHRHEVGVGKSPDLALADLESKLK